MREQFDCVLEEDGVHKSLSLYKEKRFTNLGYLAGAVYDCLPYFRKLLRETPLNNLLIRSCKLYIENPFIAAGFKALAIFTYQVTMLYLNFVEKSSQEDLINLLPKLHEDLKAANMNTMSSYQVNWTHIKVTSSLESPTELESYILKQMCFKSAQGINHQCSREYWDENAVPRATQLHLLNKSQHQNLPTNNLVTERYLVTFGYLASLSAKRSNRFFKVLRIRDDLMFWGQDCQASVCNKRDQPKIKRLDSMESDWTCKQKAIKKS